MMNRSLLPLGVILLAVGIAFITFKVGGVLISYLWPILLMLLGWFLHRMFFRGNAPAIVLVPGGLFVISSLPLLYGRWVDWSSLQYLWPLFLFGAAIGLYEYHRYSHSADRGLFMLAVSLGVVSGIALSITLFIKLSFLFVALVFVAAGIFLMRRAK